MTVSLFMLDTDTCIFLVSVLDWPQEAAQVGAADLMIAAHARAVGAIVVTNNVKDFGRVKGLQVENWTQ